MTNEERIIEKERIANAKIVYVVAPSGCGKSFTGDALAFLHDFEHVDGDGPLKNCALSERNKELTIGFLKSFKVHAIDNDEDGPEEVWTPFYEEIAALALEAAKRTDKVVLTHASYRQAYRECVVNKLLEGGAKRENITVIQLTIDADVKLAGLYYRTKEQIENGGIKLGDAMKALGWEGGSDMTMEEYKAFMMETDPGYAGNEAMKDIPDGYGSVIDVSSRDMKHVDRVEEALGLVGKRNENKNLSYDELASKVKEFEQKRDKEFDANGSQALCWGELWPAACGKKPDDDIIVTDTESTSTTVVIKEEQREEMKKRRSSLASVEFLTTEFRRASLEIESNGSSENDERIHKLKARRSSVIMTGMIDE